jgi:hypothetical protein
MNQPPIILPSHGIQIPLAQKTLIIRLHQLVNRTRITPGLGVKHPDRPRILLPAVHRLHFLIATNRFRHLGRRHRQSNQQQHQKKQNPQQQKSTLLLHAGLGRTSHWRKGNVCVL